MLWLVRALMWLQHHLRLLLWSVTINAGKKDLERGAQRPRDTTTKHLMWNCEERVETGLCWHQKHWNMLSRKMDQSCRELLNSLLWGKATLGNIMQVMHLIQCTDTSRMHLYPSSLLIKIMKCRWYILCDPWCLKRKNGLRKLNVKSNNLKQSENLIVRLA